MQFVQNLGSEKLLENHINIGLLKFFININLFACM